jgi:hypothetical protein
MTLTINNQQVSKAVINHATQMARSEVTEVVIFSMMLGEEKKHLVATAAEFDGCDNKDELNVVTRIDRDGNFVD